MPFIVRKIEPRYIGRGHVPQDNSCVEIWPVGAELEAIINGALACTLKQLASLLTNAQDIFQGLNDELGDVANRSGILRQRIHQLDNQLSSIDPKKIPVPESDISSFASRKKHFKSLQKPSTGLFSETTRPAALKKLYQQASVIAIRNLDCLKINHNENNDTTAVEMFLCTPILGKRRRDQSLDIESRVPAIFDDLRRWTSSEALGDITVPPDCMSRIIQSNDSGDFSGDDAVDHKLPSPEEQVQVIALKFPAEIVAVDISGRGFARMSMRKKLTMAQITSELNLDNDTTVKRRSKIRHNTGRSKNKRRNTIAGTDGKEIKQNIIQQASATKTDNDDEDDNIKETIYKSKSTGVSTKNRCVRSISTDILQERDTELTKWNFDAFKAWGRSRLRSMRRQSSDIDKNIKSTSNFGSAAVDNNNDEINNDAKDLMVVDKINANDDELKLDENEIKQNFSSINNINDNNVATSSIPLLLSSSSSSTTTTMHTFDRNLSHQSHHQQKIKQQQQQKHGNSNNNMLYDVRLRESAVLRRERRKGNNNNNTREDPIHSSSGNWSASSESGRTSSIGSEIISSNLPGRSSSSSSSSKLLSHNHGRRLKGRDTPTSSSVTSEASTLTPDIIQDIITYPGDDFETEGETCSIYSCDTEGYYTSFHMDSGLKTLREEELAAANANINNSFNVTLNTNTIKKTTTTTTDTVTFSNQNHNQLPSNNPNGFVENEYELFGRGSTSTTTSSAGTVCTTLMAGAPPIPPERKSSLTVVAMVHGQNNGGNSPDSGHNTCSSPVESASASSPACYTARSCSELEYSESSDLEGYDRIERLRNKTAISTNRIPSMCVITPSGSDDEQAQQSQQQQQQQQPNFNKILQLHNTNSVSYDELVNKSVVGVGNKIKTCQDSGDYVTIADFRNNKDRYRQKNITQVYANIESKKQSQSPKKSKLLQDEFESAEYVSLSDLPKKSDCSLERKRRQGARVVLDYQGKVIYSSDSLKRRKESHTTFNPGPFIKESSPIIAATNRNEKPHSESPRGIIKPRAFVNLAHQHQQHQQQQSESSIASTVSTASSIATPAELEKVKIEENIKEEDTNWIHSEDSHREKKLQDQKNNISTINYKNLSLANKKRQYSDGLLSGEMYHHHHHHQSVEELVTPDITRDLGNTLINNSQIELQDNKNKIYNNILDNKKKYESNHQTQRCLMPLNLNTYDGNNQITTSSPLSQKFKENQPSEKMVVNDRLERLERKDFFNNSTLSPIPSSNSYYSNNFYSPSNNSLIKNNKTMSNDELFTAIYKSKRKLNIKNDNEISVGTTSTTAAPATIDDSLIDISNYVPDDNNKIGTRHSWSPESSQTNNNIKKLVSPSCINQEMSQKNTKTAAAAMTRLDFKRLLLQQSTKNRSSSLSAAEQLKLSNPSNSSNSSNLSKGTGRQVNYYGINDNNNKQIIPNSTTTIKKLNTLSTLDQRCTNYNSSGWYLSRAQQKTIFPNPYINKHDSINSYNHQKSIWKYQIPRSNILSCTIIEDVAAEETAVEQFLESPPPSPLLTLPSATSSFSPSPSPTLINDSDSNFYKNHFKSSENNDIDNIFSNKLFEFDNSTNNDSNNSKLVSAHFEAESLKKRNNELKAQFLSNNKVDNNIIIFDEKNQIKSGPTKDTDADAIIQKSPTSSVIVNNITNNSKVSRNTTTPTSALETAL